MNDRLTGYLALAVLSCIAAIGVGLVAHTLAQPSQERFARFDNVGALKLADPVMQQGVEIGRVKRIGRSGNAALLSLQFSPPRPIYANYAVQVVDLGIMGDRFVAIDCGTPDYPAVDKADTLVGQFMIGPSEALGMVGRLHEVVRSFAAMSTRLAYGDSSKAPFAARYVHAVRFVDSLSAGLLALTRSTEVLLNRRTGSLYATVDSASQLASRLSERGPDMVAELVTAVQKVDSAVAKMEVMVAGLGKAAQALQGVQGAEMEQRVRSIQGRLGEIRELLDDIQRRGVNLRVWPF
jgi:ABC-type transporter Mla subunit MlaD